MAETQVMGVDVLVKIGTPTGTAILGQREAELTVEADMADLTTKLNGPGYVFQPTGDYKWEIGCNGLVSVGGTQDAMDLLDTLCDGTSCSVTFEVGGTTDTAAGTAYIRNLRIAGSRGAEGATYSCTLQGSGTLTITQST